MTTSFTLANAWCSSARASAALRSYNSRNISPGIPAAARNFVGQQRWCVLGAADAAGAMWACMLSGEPGFVQASDDLRSLQVASSDPQSVAGPHGPHRRS
ncbi:hypothetical protein [Comamonas sp. JC664]|uniref:hypothetical protein n=1 Tax=Comamonas sp. JC664 TaxID=2801917 RepID=UPI003617D562